MSLPSTLYVINAQEDPEDILPTTRYLGSKRKLVNWIWRCISKERFDRCLEAFGGTGSFSYLMKSLGKEVTYNDSLRFNYLIGKALIENSRVKLSDQESRDITKIHPCMKYPSFIFDNFSGLYFTDRENAWLDTVTTNIRFLHGDYKKSIAIRSLCQAAIMKRPYNLFHRVNLYMRLAKVKRTFGNLTTWETPFPSLFQRFVTETNEHVFDNGRNNIASNLDALNLESDYDLVYVDSPYMTPEDGGIDYRDYYHFLEGLSRYDEWPSMVNYSDKRKTMLHEYSIWLDRKKIESAFDQTFDHFRRSKLVVSYRTGGIPTYATLKRLLHKYKRNVALHKRQYTYSLAKRTGWELLFVAG